MAAPADTTGSKFTGGVVSQTTDPASRASVPRGEGGGGCRGTYSQTHTPPPGAGLSPEAR